MEILVIALTAALVIAAVLFVRWWTWRPVVKHRAVVQMVDGTAFDGAIMSRRGALLVMSDVTARIPGGEQRLDGQVVVERSRVAYMQVVN